MGYEKRQQGVTTQCTALLCAVVIAWLLCANALAQNTQPLHFSHQLFVHDTEIRQLGGINETVQDEYGFMWFAGTQALGRYDGTTLKIYNNIINDIHLNITISIGGDLHHDNEPFEEACQRADEALYAAKNSGRNLFCGV